MSKGKHLTLDDRKSIQMGLQEGRNFQEIAREIGKDPSTVSKEIVLWNRWIFMSRSSQMADS